MRVGLNATCFNDRPSGANQRFAGIYGALIRRRRDIEFVVYEPADQRIGHWFADAPNVLVRRTPLPSVGRLSRVWAGLGYWSRQLRADRLDLFEAFHLPLVRAPDCPTILTIHDLRPVLPNVPRPRRDAADLVMHHALGHADRVIAVSDAIADEIRVFHPSAKVSTVYNGVDGAGFAMPDAAQVAAVRTRYALPDAYLLAIGHLETRKNLPVLIEAVARLRDRGTPRLLVIVGNDGGERAAILSRIAALRLADLVTVIGNADDETVRALYAGCTMLAFPSRYEGFGIPILEAMAADRPMILSDIPVFRELTLDRGVYFSPDDPEAAAAAIGRVWQNPEEAARQRWLGAARLPDFGFDRLADQVAAIYGSLT